MSMTIYDDYVNYTQTHKKEYGEKTLVLIEVGSFWEMYNCDKDLGAADIKGVSELLGIIVSKKNKSIPNVSAQNPLMAGFPSYCISKFLPILIENNYTIVLVGQVTPPPNPKRAITKIVSKSTCSNVDDVILTSGGKGIGEITNILCCIFIEELKHDTVVIGMTFLDCSNGRSSVYEIASKQGDTDYPFDEAYHYILLHRPCEIVLYGTLNTLNKDEVKTKIGIRPNVLTHDYLNLLLTQSTSYTLQVQSDMISELFTGEYGMLSPFEYVGLERNTHARMSFLLAIDFAKRHDQLLVQKIHKPDVSWDSRNMLLSHNCIEQLDLQSLEKILNCCSTGPGKRLFRYKLLHPSTDIKDIQTSYDRISNMLNRLPLNVLDQAASSLQKMYDIERLLRKIMLKTIAPGDVANLVSSLETFDSVCKGYNLDSHQDIEKMCRSIKSVVDIDACSRFSADNGEFINIFQNGYFTDIDVKYTSYTSIMKDLETVVGTLNDKLCKGSSFFKLEYNDRDGIYISVTTKRYKDLQKDIESIQTLSPCGTISNGSVTKLSSPKFDRMWKERLSLEASMRQLHLHNFSVFMDIFNNNFTKQVVFNVINFVANLDVDIANARNATKYSYCKPLFNNENTASSNIQCKGLRHAIVERLDCSKCRYVTNDISLSNQGILLYGLNAAGKSTLMKALGLVAIMAQAGMYVPCDSMVYTPYDHLFTRITRQDDLFTGKSTFMVEMLELRNILQRCNENSLVIGDEICSGTESCSAIGIVASAINTLSEKHCAFIFATHLHDLIDLDFMKALSTQSRLQVCHLHVYFDRETNALVYDRKLRDGPGIKTYGIEVCRALNMPDTFLDFASKIRKQYVSIHDDSYIPKQSRYNSKLVVNKCSICGSNANLLETHHIKEQHTADANNMIDTRHKNHISNLVVLCNKCHDKVHSNQIQVEDYVQTSQGVKLQYKESNNASNMQSESQTIVDLIIDMKSKNVPIAAIARQTGRTPYFIKKTINNHLCIKTKTKSQT